MAAKPFVSYLRKQNPEHFTSQGKFRNEPIRFDIKETKRIKKKKKREIVESLGSSVGSVLAVGEGEEEKETEFEQEESKSAEADEKKLMALRAAIPSLPADLFDEKELRQIGKGAYGKVYVVKHAKTKETIVVKRIAASSPSAVAKVVREAAILRHVKSFCKPYLLCGGDLYQTPTEFWIVTEFLGNYETLNNIKTLRLTDPERIEICEMLVFAVAQLHKARVAHRDIKPENVMVAKLERKLNIKVLDFGEACLSTDCQTKEVVGTPLYMAPEVLAIGPDSILLDNQPVETRVAMTFEFWVAADLWSLGVTLLEFLMGTDVFYQRILQATDLSSQKLQVSCSLLSWSKTGIPKDVWLDLFQSHYLSATLKVYIGDRIMHLLDFEPARRALTLFPPIVPS